jgi:penicillin-binding protein 1C
MSVKQFGNISIIVFVIWFSAYIYAPHLIIDLQFSPVLYSKEGKLLAAKVSEDGQWRFPPVDSLSYQYINCLKAFEDKRFDSHIGFDPIAFFRAILSNVKARKVNSGGSTITMQFARLLLGNPPRTLFNKIKETWIAIGIESNFTKDQILRYYSSVAPYGGNVVGIQAASWRYFQRNTLQLNWAESALLAVLPNQPSFMHLKKNRDALLQKRNRLLKKLWINNQLDLETYHLAILEPIPDQLFAMPKSGIHLLEYLKKKFPNQYKFNSTINLPIQQNFIEISTHHSRYLIENNIHNLSILLIDNKSSEVLSYVANTQLNSDIVKNGHVNNIHAARSSGSILKPILYACSLDRGLICPGTLLPDIPTLISGFRPENFSRTYEGALPAYQCIQRSLNIPSVRLLQWYGLENFYLQLKQGGFSTLFRTSDEYGLSLILGGAEVTAWDLAKVYSGLAQSLIEPSIPDNKKEISGMHVYKHNDKSLEKDPIITNISPTAIYQMIDCMKGSVLPDDLATQFYLENKHKIAWKTGTSFGFKVYPCGMDRKLKRNGATWINWCAYRGPSFI